MSAINFSKVLKRVDISYFCTKKEKILFFCFEVNDAMNINLIKKPKNAIIIDGFPGFGLVGTITTEFLIEHLNAELIGSFEYDELTPVVAIHKGEIVHPMGVFYDSKNNMIILHTILNPQGFEWKIADAIMKMSSDLDAKELISIDGISGILGEGEKDLKSYFYVKDAKKKEKLSGIGLEAIKESVVMGVTGALLLKSSTPVTCLFASTTSALPDSKASAEIIKALDKYLGLNVDYKPLLRQAQEFEHKVKDILEKSSQATKDKNDKQLNYVG